MLVTSAVAEPEGEGAETPSPGPALDWVDIVATVVMAIAALFTAWSAYQSDQWGDTISFSLAEAAAARTEASRLYTRAGELSNVDVNTYIAWLEAVQSDVASGDVDPTARYEPDPSTLSGFLYLRFRPPFAAAMDAWLATRPFAEPDAPPTPFAMEDYRVAEAEEAARLQVAADDKAADARAADDNDDKYVLSTIIFAGIFLFAGLSTKMRTRTGQILMLGFALALLIAGGVFLLTVPILV